MYCSLSSVMTATAHIYFFFLSLRFAKTCDYMNVYCVMPAVAYIGLLADEPGQQTSSAFRVATLLNVDRNSCCLSSYHHTFIPPVVEKLEVKLQREDGCTTSSEARGRNRSARRPEKAISPHSEMQRDSIYIKQNSFLTIGQILHSDSCTEDIVHSNKSPFNHAPRTSGSYWLTHYVEARQALCISRWIQNIRSTPPRIFADSALYRFPQDPYRAYSVESRGLSRAS